MGRKYAKAPVYFTIGQVRHNPLLSLKSYLPAIQERMRKAGYPDFKSSQQMQFSFAAVTGSDDSQPFQPGVQQVESYTFSNLEGTQGFLMEPSALSFRCTEYETFPEFYAELERGLSILEEAVGGLAYFERLGLRYLDAVVPAEGETLQQYLAQEVWGTPASLDLGQVYQFEGQPLTYNHSFAESSATIPNIGQVVSRVIVQNSDLRFPPDLLPDPLKVSERFRGLNCQHATVDVDASFSDRLKYDSTEIRDRFQHLHDLVELFFNATVTDHARKAWS
ncbi:TIGR04255 family protein [Pseudomonas aeruginosa]|nr:TIGR04255 family protein [Pseudomonas aeruginosa]MDF5838119.1 TIGR04255 family protein [Pseudomonas aeruginosa]MDF5863258.1 TIGR04255 family protein [Pseudomonas aeruginosa]MDF5901201.1 TIGR04255 family protein [Pseudomonas aeruginosa]HEN8800086.1 TIGR04255 family protein [Pseudomonas putida]